MRRLTALALALALTIALSCCAEKPVQQGMVTANSLTFLASTVTDEKAGTVAVTVTMTNGTGAVLYLAAPELTTADGTTAAYLDMSIAGVSNELTNLPETGLTRWLHLDPRESYSETCIFTASLPATLSISVQSSASYSGKFTQTTVELPLN